MKLSGHHFLTTIDKIQAKYFSKRTLNSEMFSGGEMKEASSGNFGPARLYIVSGGSVSRIMTL